MNLVCRLLLEKNFFNDTATTEIYTLSLHDALPISSLAYTESNFDTTAVSWAGAKGLMQLMQIGRAHV